MHESGKDIVFTCGVAGTDPGKHAITSIADLMHFSLDVRSIDAPTVLGFIDYAKQYAGDTVYWDELVTTPGIKIKVETLEGVAAATKKLGIEAITMPSGAGHDAAIFAQSGVEAGMVFVRNQHGSHNPHEDMNIDDFMLGVETLWEVVR
jgi:N-carbamoyl-L-amino-acid hydrolase